MYGGNRFCLRKSEQSSIPKEKSHKLKTNERHKKKAKSKATATATEKRKKEKEMWKTFND